MYISTFFLFLNKWNCFRTVELHFVQLIVILLHLTTLTGLILYYFNFLYYWSNWTEYFFLYLLLLSARPQIKALIEKFRLMPRKTSISGIALTFFINLWCFQCKLPNIVVTWAKLWWQTFSIQITQYCDNVSKVVGQTSQAPISFYKRWGGNFVCDSSVKKYRIDLMKACHPLPSLLPLHQFNEITNVINI